MVGVMVGVGWGQAGVVGQGGGRVEAGWGQGEWHGGMSRVVTGWRQAGAWWRGQGCDRVEAGWRHCGGRVGQGGGRVGAWWREQGGGRVEAGCVHGRVICRDRP